VLIAGLIADTILLSIHRFGRFHRWLRPGESGPSRRADTARRPATRRNPARSYPPPLKRRTWLDRREQHPDTKVFEAAENRMADW